ncbi:MAG: hypothetical protein ACREQ9_13600, partial [Candidatus Binatia bacterium]
ELNASGSGLPAAAGTSIETLSMPDPHAASDGSLERVRRAASYAAVAVFGTSFAILLVLSATPYWRPDNELLTLCDRVWRVSGITALVLGSIPHLRRLAHRVIGWLSPDGRSTGGGRG